MLFQKNPPTAAPTLATAHTVREAETRGFQASCPLRPSPGRMMGVQSIWLCEILCCVYKCLLCTYTIRLSKRKEPARRPSPSVHVGQPPESKTSSLQGASGINGLPPSRYHARPEIHGNSSRESEHECYSFPSRCEGLCLWYARLGRDTTKYSYMYFVMDDELSLATFFFSDGTVVVPSCHKL